MNVTQQIDAIAIDLALLAVIAACKHPSGFNDYLPEWKSEVIHRLKVEGYVRVKRVPAAGMGDVAMRVATITKKGRERLGTRVP